MIIEVNNNKCKVLCELKLIMELRTKFRIRVAGAFHSMAFRKREWDGFKYYVTEAGYFETGYLPTIYNYLISKNHEVKIRDYRDELKTFKLPETIGGKIPRDYQMGALNSIKHNKVAGIKFQRGIIDGATNFGKLLLAVMIYKTFKLPTIFIPNSKELFEQALKELPELIGDNLGQISSKKIVWADFMVCMPLTMKNRKHIIKHKLEGYPVLLIDEGDLATSKTYWECIMMCYNAIVKICLSGTVFMHKDPNKNEQIRAHFGEILYTMTKKQLIEAGVSSELSICVCAGNLEVRYNGDYKREYLEGIIKNVKRHRRIYKRVNHFLGLEQYPQLLIAKDRNHIQRVYRYLKNKFEGTDWIIEWVDHERPERAKIRQDFYDGKIDVLVGSLIYKRGINFPLCRYVANIGGGDSKRTFLQIMGRAERTHDSKNITHVDDFYDIGMYLARHSKHRIQAIKSTGLKFTEVYKDAIKLK